jgi:hypothetical protein
MKKIISLIICVFLTLQFCACKVENTEEISSDAFENENKTLDTESTKKVISTYKEYVTFDKCFDYATDVVKAKCIDIITTGQSTEYEFEVIKRFLGEEVENNIFVYVPYDITDTDPKVVYSDWKAVNYEINSEYYLILSRHCNVYRGKDKYLDYSGDIYIPAFDISKATYYNDPLTAHSSAASLSTEQELVEHIIECIDKRDPKIARVCVGAPYIKETDTQSVISKSEFVLRIKIGEKMHDDNSEICQVFECNVISNLKGNITVGKNIEVAFFPDTVSTGTEYIVALTPFYENELDTFVFSSKNSLFSVDDLEEIQKYLDN